MTGLVVYLFLLLVVRTIRRLLDRGRAFRLMMRVFFPSATDDLRVDIEEAGLRAVILPRHGFAAKAFIFSLPSVFLGVMAFFFQDWLRPSPWVTAVILSSVIASIAALDHVAFRARGYEPVGGVRSGKEWGLLVPAIMIRVGISTTGFAAAYLGIRTLNDSGVLLGLGWMLLSIVLLGVAHFPVVLADRLSRRLRRIDFATTTSTDSTLLLRSFADDQLSLVSDIAGTGPAAPQLVLARTRFEESIAQALFDSGPLIAIGRPGERLPELGAARTYWADDDWKSAVEATAYRAENVVMIAGLSQGLAWEIDKLRSWGMLRKLLVLIPPDRADPTAQRIVQVIDDLGIKGFPQEAALAPMIIGFAFTKDETPVVYLADGPTWEAYMATVVIHRATWAKGNEPPRTVQEVENAFQEELLAVRERIESGDYSGLSRTKRAMLRLADRLGSSAPESVRDARPTPVTPMDSVAEARPDTQAVASPEPAVLTSLAACPVVFARSAQESRYSMDTLQLFDLARREAQRIGESDLSRHHLLLALTSAYPDIISSVLGRSADEVRRAQLEHMDLGWELVPDVQGTSPQFKRFLRYLPTVADALERLEIGPVTILLALIGEASGPLVGAALASIGVDESSSWDRARQLPR
jgi:hypothetical protein